jgi:hypothetical protein
VQDFHDSKGGLGADTGPAARKLLESGIWSPADYLGFKQKLTNQGIPFFESESGFVPP